jgi:hypothetical protein
MFTGFTVSEFIPDRLTLGSLVRNEKQRRYTVVNVTLRRVRENIVVVKNNTYYIF